MNRTAATVGLIATITILLSVAAPALLPTADAQADHAHERSNGDATEKLPGFADIAHAVAVMHPTAGNEARGIVRFREVEDGRVRIVARIEGLPAGRDYGFHVHEFGDCTADDGTSAGSHYNPEGHPHGLPNGDERHAGDFGNLTANNNGVAELDLTVDNLTIAGMKNPLAGRGVIVHGDPDDGSQPLGNAGPRIGCGAIGVTQP